MDTLFVGRNRINLSETESTNNYALHNTHLPEGTLISADFQSAGKGQRNKSWQSEHGKNLLFSVLFKPTFLHPSKLFSLNKAVALALCTALADYTTILVPAIKWPNDIYVADRKLAGILTESQVNASQIVSYVAGIGLNINQTIFEGLFPEPISLKLIHNQDISLELVLSSICKQMEIKYLMLQRGEFEQIDYQFNQMLWKRGETIRFLYLQKECEGRLIETDRIGRLVMETAEGIQYYQTGDIRWII